MEKNDVFLYQYYLEKNDFFTCHEVLEEAWKREDKTLNKDSDFVCLIQYACLLLHLRDDNKDGYNKTLINLKEHLTKDASKGISIYYLNFEEEVEKLDKYRLFTDHNLLLKEEYLNEYNAFKEEKDLELLTQYINKDNVRHTFAFSMLDKYKLLKVFTNKAIVSGYYILTDESYFIINFNENITDHDVMTTLHFIMSSQDIIIDFTCDEYTLDKLSKSPFFDEMFEPTVCKLAYLDKKIEEDVKYEVINPYKDRHHEVNILLNKAFEHEYDESEKNFAEDKALNTFVIYQDNQVVFTSSLSNQKYKSSMITGVATDEDYQNKGIASSGVTYISNLLLDKGITPVLFYTNPKAASIYKRLGYKDTDYNYIVVKYKK